MRKIRIVFTIPNFITAGSGREMLNIIDRLDPAQFEVSICIKNGGGALEQEIREKQYRLITKPFYCDMGNPFKMVWEIWRISRYFRKYNFDLWHSFNWSSDFTEVLIARLSGARFLYTKKNMNWSRRAWKIKSQLSNHIVARNTTMLSAYFQVEHYRNKVTHITGGVEGIRFAEKATSFEYRKRFALKETDYVITCVAQVIPIKGQHLLIEAVREIPDAVVYLAGAERNSEYVSLIKQRIDEYGLAKRIFMLGSVKDVAALLKESNAFVLPTTKDEEHEEGCPVALLEAMASGLPCIASNVAGSIDLIKHEVTGLLFTSGDSEELSKAIQRLMKQPELAKELGRQANRETLNCNTLEIEGDRFSTLYKKMISA